MNTGNSPGRPKGTPKTGGRKVGTPNKITTEARTACGLIVDDPEYGEALKQRMIAGTAGQMEAIVWYYAKGKPRERVEVGANKTLAQLVREAVEGPEP